MNKLDLYNENIFENIKHSDEYGKEYWFARDLQKVLEYKEWRNFHRIINKAVISAKNSVSFEEDWVVEVNKPIKTGKGKEEFIKDYKLPRYICYLIVQNADPNKEIVALGQTYFTIQTRKQELSEKEYDKLTEDEKRFYQRSLTKKGNYSLNKAAKEAGIKNFDKFHNDGYRGLYNGDSADDIAKRKKLRYREEILDNMGSEELVDNLFRITHTEQKLKREKIKGEKQANMVHYKMGKDIRDFIEKQGGTMPEDLPKPNKSLKELEKENKLMINNCKSIK